MIAGNNGKASKQCFFSAGKSALALVLMLPLALAFIITPEIDLFRLSRQDSAVQSALALEEGLEGFDWYQFGYEKGQYDAMYNRGQDPDYWDNDGSEEYYNGYSAGYESVNFRDWFAEGLANGRADREQGYGYQPLAWPNDGSPNYYAGYDSGYKGIPIDWYNAGWYNGLNDARYGMLYRPDVYYNNQSAAYYEGYYDGYYGSFDVNTQLPGPEEQPDNEAEADSDSDTDDDQLPAVVPVQSSFTLDNPACIIDGSPLLMDAAPYAAGNRVLVPVRYLAYMCGLADGDILWDQAAQKVVLQQPGGSTLVFTLGSVTFQADERIVVMDAAPESRANRVFLPARYVAENLGCVVEWNAAGRTVTVKASKSVL